MPIDLFDYLDRLNELHRLSKNHSTFLQGALDSLDGSIRLIGMGNLPQSLVLAFAAIELSLKAEIHSFDPSLVFKPKDRDRTICLEKALEHVRSSHKTLIDSAHSRLIRFKDERNKVIHGPDPATFSTYAPMLASEVFPFIEKYLSEAFGLRLEALLTSPVYRELLVARRVCRASQLAKLPPPIYCLQTLSHSVLHSISFEPDVPDEASHLEGERRFRISQRLEKELPLDVWTIKTSCRICDHYPLFVDVEVRDAARNRIIAKGVQCPFCGLTIQDNSLFLAHFHIGDFTKAELDEFFDEYVPDS